MIQQHHLNPNNPWAAKPSQSEPPRPVEHEAETPQHKPVAVPNRAQYFDNDLSDEEKQTLIDKLVASAKAVLAEPRVTVNSVARLMAMEHNKVKAGLGVSTSLKDFLSDHDGSKGTLHIKKAFARLSPDEQKIMLAQLQSMQV